MPSRWSGSADYMLLRPSLRWKNKIEVDINNMIFRKISMRPAFAEPAINFPVSIRLLRDGLIDASALISNTFGFDEAKSVMGR